MIENKIHLVKDGVGAVEYILSFRTPTFANIKMKKCACGLRTVRGKRGTEAGALHRPAGRALQQSRLDAVRRRVVRCVRAAAHAARVE